MPPRKRVKPLHRLIQSARERRQNPTDPRDETAAVGMELTMQKDGKTSMVKAQAYLKAGKIKKWVMLGGYCRQDSSVELELSVLSRATVMLPCERPVCQIACET